MIKEAKFKDSLPYLLILFSSLLVSFNWSNGTDWGDDFAAYILQAISIANGEVSKFISQNHFTIHDSSYPVGPVTYPWGFPLLLFPVYEVFGLNFLSFKVVSLVFFIFFLLTLKLGFKRYLDYKEIVIFMAFFALNIEFINFADMVLSDIPFLFFSTLAIVLMSGKLALKSKKQAFIIFTSLGIVIACAVMIRTNGILLLITYIFILTITFFGERFSQFKIYFCDPFKELAKISNTFKWMCRITPVLIILTIVVIANQILPDKQKSHLDFLTNVSINSIIDNTRYYAFLPASFFSPKDSLGKAIYLVTFIFFIIGIKDKWKSTMVFIIYMVLTLSLYLIWPPRQGLRFLYPVMPFYVFYFLIGIRKLSKLSKYTSTSIIFSSLIIIVVLIPTAITSIAHRALWRDIEGPLTSQSQEMFKFITEKTYKDEVVVFFKPRAMRLFTGRDSLVYSKPEDFRIREIYVYSKDHDHLNVRQLDLLSKLHPFTKIFENDKFIVYRFKST
jgi:hypothetical protein